MALISVVIPTTGNMVSLDRCLSSLARQEFSGNVELIVVFNPPNPKLETSVVEKWGARIFSNEIVGANRARNCGIENASGEIVVFLDDDCEAIRPNFLQAHWDLHLERADVAGIGGNYLLPEDADKWARLYFQQQQLWIMGGERPGYFSDLILGGNFSVKRQKLGALRFANDLVYGGTETDFVFLLAANGRTVIFSEDPKVVHHVKVGAWGLFRKALLQGMGAKSLQQKKYYGVVRTIRSNSEVHEIVEEEKSFYSGLYRFFFQLGYLVGNKSGKSWAALFGWGIYLLIRLGCVWLKRRFFDLWRTAELFLYVNRESGRKKG